MNVKPFLATVLLLMWKCAMVCQAQSFTPEVIGSAGTFASSANGSMAWTIGEVITETGSSPGNYFTQGFHQPDSNTWMSVAKNSIEHISVYPNPVVDKLIIDFGDAPGEHVVYIYDMRGQLLLKGISSGTGQQLTISFNEFSNGTYLINIINTELNSSSLYKINKGE